ncbi:MAG: indolepyruvate ferredoxin oxidoreductase subunit alpha [Deltaproteobacteria bacterium]|nr:indolepyruvate ferredoxin oxidoreductase subunit alpha [Deltaproteobacteria bacterium]
MTKEILSGNEAIARGAWEAGVTYAAAYPGTPSTEILESLGKDYRDIYSQWSPNEKVALETAVGASLAGARALACMKHVGVNVAADPLFTAIYTGVNGGLVLVTADDPNLHSSQNEQDNRNYAKFAKLPLIEPSDSQEAKDFLKAAFDLSEQFDTPVLFRTTTRVNHSKSVVELGERVERPKPQGIARDTKKYTMLPGFARPKHPKIEERLQRIKEYGVESPLNRVEMGDTRVGIVTSGISYQYAKEALPGASFLKLGLTYPLPEALVRDFAQHVDQVIVVEELDPFLEEQIRLLGIEVAHGKDLFPIVGELEPSVVAQELTGAAANMLAAAEGLPIRPPVLCPGCSHRGVFTVLRKLKVFVSGDIGCYTLGALPPLEAMHACLCMGGSIPMAHGISKVVADSGDLKDRVVAVIGDSTFFHSGVTGLIDLIWNGGTSVVIIQDNRITGMTGGQENPGTGHTLSGGESPQIDMERLVLALGVKPANVRVVSAYDLKEVEAVLREELGKPEPSVVITKDPCVLQYKVKKPALTVDPEVCTACKQCLRVGCIALSLEGEGDAAHAVIDPNFCVGCTVCAQVCKFDAIGAPKGAA